jgi:hypothetical protein
MIILVPFIEKTSDLSLSPLPLPQFLSPFLSLGHEVTAGRGQYVRQKETPSPEPNFGSTLNPDFQPAGL